MYSAIFFWCSLLALFLTLFLLFREVVSLSLVFSGVNALAAVLADMGFYISAGVFLGSFIILILPHIIAALYSKATIKRRMREEEFVYGYVTETIYPDIPGRVMIKGESYRASCARLTERGCVVKCAVPGKEKTEILN